MTVEIKLLIYSGFLFPPLLRITTDSLTPACISFIDLKLTCMQFRLLLLGLLAFAQSPHAQSALFFSHSKATNVKKIEMADDFSRGDTIYGMLYINPQNSNEVLESYTVTRDGNAVVPIYVSAENGVAVRFYADLASGTLKPPKKSGFIKAINSAINDQKESQVFYFQVLPTSSNSLDMNWIKFFANLSRSPGSIQKIKVTVGTGELFRTASGQFAMDFSGGAEPYSNWVAPYLEQESKAKQAEKEKIKSDSSAKASAAIEAAYDNTEKSFPPATFKNKIKDPKLLKELASYYKEHGYDLYKFIIADAENSSSFWIFGIGKSEGKCYIMSELLERDNPYGDLVKFKVVEHNSQYKTYSEYPLRCEKVQDYLK
jgi:hypothetical protein